MEIKIPAHLEAEHNDLYATLIELTELPGEVGRAATKVAGLLQPHFLEEEEYALPPLGLLLTLSAGEASSEMQSVVVMTDRLQARLHQMRAQHQGVLTALEELVAAGRRERRPTAVRLAKALRHHAELEDEVLYPAAILVGEYVKMLFGADRVAAAV